MCLYVHIQKLQDKTAVFNKLKLSAKDKEKWERVLISDIMSSEDSCSDNDDVFIKEIPWRSQIVDTFRSKLDEKVWELKSPLAKRMRKERKVSKNVSERDIPSGIPKWAIKTNTM